MAYTRLFKYWSGISHYSSTACKCSPARSLPPFTLRRPVSALNDSLFPNSSWFMMSNPKIPSKNPVPVKLQPSNKLSPLSPQLHFNRYEACLPPWRQRDWRGLTSAPLVESQCQEATAKKERALSRLVAVLLTSSPTPLSCIYANGLRCKGTQRMTHCLKKKKIDGTISRCPFHKHYLSLRLSRGAQSQTKIGD